MNEQESKIKELERKIVVLEQRLALYEKDPAKRGYFALAYIVNQQVDIVKEFKLKDEITKNPKDDKYYDRVKGLWEGLKEMILELRNLRIELKISDDDKDDDTPFIESVAKQRT